MSKALIITGSSRGIGEAIAIKYLKEGYQVFGISRTRTELSIEYPNFTHVKADISRLLEVRHAWLEAKKSLDQITALSEVQFIHNAGILGPMNMVGQGTRGEVHLHALQVNVVSALDFCERFIEEFQDFGGTKKLILISSGAGRKPYPGWANYCVSKAGLDMFAQVMATEQQSKELPIQIASIAPGVVDTNMQGKIREMSQAHFPHVQRFLDLKENDQLWKPDFVAEKLFNYVQSKAFGTEILPDLRKI